MAFETSDGTLKLITYVSVVRRDAVLLVKYVTPPNPDKAGWWVPAPEIEFGQDPLETVGSVLGSLGLSGATPDLVETESFTVGGAWHLMLHYRVTTDMDPAPDATYDDCAWFAAADLPPAGDFAHGGWERSLVERRLTAPLPVAR